jgi:hypothetical protein
MSSFLSFLSLRDEEKSSSKPRTFIGGGIHAVLHGIPAVLSVLSLHVISNASEFSLGVVFLLSTVLSLMGFLRVLRANDGKLEGDITRALRNFLSAGLIAAAFVFLGQSDASNSTLNRDSLIAVIVLTCVGKFGDVFANKEDVLREDLQSSDKYFLARQIVTYVLIVLSTIALVVYKVIENTDGMGSSTHQGLLIGAFIVLGVHLLLNPLNMLYKCYRPDTQMIPLTRNPLIRHLTTSTGISFLAYALGYGVARDEKYVYLLSSLIGYLLADATGRGMDVVAL